MSKTMTRHKSKKNNKKTGNGDNKKKIPEKSGEPVSRDVLIIVLVMLLLSAFLIGFTQYITTTTLNVDIRALSMNAELDAELTQNGLKYELLIDRGEGGGMLPGFGLGQGGAFDNISNEALYFEGLDEFQENIGLLLNSYKDRYYSISADTSGTGDLPQRTVVNVSSHTDLIPFWPSGLDQDFEIRVELGHRGAAQKVVIEEVQIQLWQDPDADGLGLTRGQVVWSIKPGDEIYNEGSSRTYRHSFSLEGYEDVIGLLGYVKVSFFDKNGNRIDENLVSNIAEPDPETEDIPLSLTTNIKVLSRTETTQLGMLLISFPMSMISLIIVIISIILIPIFIKRKYSMNKLAAIIMAAAIIQMLAFVFLYMGIDNLVNILDDSLKADLKEDYHWTAQFYLILVPGILQALGSILILVTARKPGKKSEKVTEADTFSIVDE